MIGDIQHGSIWDAIVSLWIPVTITAGASIYIARLTYRIGKKVDTGNERDIGETVHDMAQTVEVLSAQIHTNTGETLEARAKAEHAATEAEHAAKKAETAVQRLEDWIEESVHLHAEILRRLPEKR